MADATTTAEQSFGATATRLSPGVRRRLGEQDLEAGDVRVSRGGRVTVGVVEPSELVSSCAGNRVTRDDAERAVEAARTQGEPASHRTMSAPRAAEAPAPGDAAGRSETVEPSRTRRTIAERMRELETADLLGGAA